tara:strand:+ start:439 stop:711 length:273 start_codon:yes stop_codon:yes gene_type:complete
LAFDRAFPFANFLSQSMLFHDIKPISMKNTLVILVLLVLVGCNTIKTEHTVKITMDVNVKLDRELDDVFGELDELSASSETTPAETEKKD